MGEVVSVICPYYRGEKYLKHYLSNVLEQTIVEDIELIVDHNDPTTTEIETINSFKKEFPGRIIHNTVEPVVPVSKSMNNCINSATGKYLCIWNVDDIRVPDSLERMRATIQSNPEADFTYGDIIVINDFNKREGIEIASIEYDRTAFIRGMHCGPFYMWRVDREYPIHVFDEQFLSGADYDFAVRLALTGRGKRTESLIGYYLNEGLGASTGGTHVPKNIQPIERTVIELRYGAYDKIKLEFLPEAVKYNIPNILYDGRWLDIAEYYPMYNSHLKETKHLIYKIKAPVKKRKKPAIHKRIYARIAAIFRK